MYSVYLWLLGAGATLLAEIGHPGLFLALSFSVGSLAAAGIAYYKLSVTCQLFSFIGTAIISFACLRTYIAKKSHSHPTNAQALIGAQGIITERITPTHPGRVKINGEEWRAKSMHEISLEPGSRIRVIRMERTTLIVSSH